MADKRPVKKGKPSEDIPVLGAKGQLSFKFEGTSIDTTRAKVGGASNIPCGRLRYGDHIRVVHECTVREVRHFQDKNGFFVREHRLEIDSTKPIELL